MSDKPVGLFRRLASIGYDTLILIGLLMVATAVWLPFTGGQAIDPGHIGYQVYLLVFIVGYFALSWRRGGQTIGMKAWQFQVQSIDGGPLDGRQALLRCALAVVSWAALGAGFWWVWIDPKRRAWHDRGSSTQLVRWVKVKSTSRSTSSSN